MIPFYPLMRSECSNLRPIRGRHVQLCEGVWGRLTCGVWCGGRLTCGVWCVGETNVWCVVTEAALTTSLGGHSLPKITEQLS